MKIEIGDREYNVKLAVTDEEKTKGLQDVTELPEDSGMLFVYEEPQTVGFWMEDTAIPLDIIFISEDQEVLSVYQGMPYDKTIAEEDNVKYVLEVNQGSGIEEGDEMEMEEGEKETMSVIGPDGNSQMELEGGERIFRRAFTKQLIYWAKKIYNEKNEDKKIRLYKRLGKKMFKELDAQDSRPPEYV